MWTNIVERGRPQMAKHFIITMPRTLCWYFTSLYFGFAEDGALTLKHVGMLRVLYDVVSCAFVGLCNYL
jgi:hypothetical protein